MAQPGVVAPWRATYVPGEWYVIAGPTALVVLQPGPTRSDMIADLWADVVASASMSDLVDRLAGYGITELPDLAVVFWSAAGMRTLVRGGVALVDPGSGDPIATGDGLVTWNEVGLEHLDRVQLRLPEQSADGDLLPLAVGVVRAGAVSLSSAEGDVVRSPQPLLRSAAVGAVGSGAAMAAAGGAGAMSPESIQPDPSGSEPEVSQAESTPSAAESESGSSGAAAAGADPDDTGPDFPALDADDEESAVTGASVFDAVDGPWGPQAAPTPGEPGPVGAAALGATGGAVAAAGAAAPGGPGFGGGAGLADPRAAGSSASPAEPAEPAEPAVEQYEMEHGDTQLMAGAVPGVPDSPGGGGGSMAGGSFPGASAPTQPLVEAVRCPNGHLNGPGSSTCRICRAPLGGRAPEMAPQPLLARLRAADGMLVDLDRAVLLGRAPSEQRSTVPLPRLVTLASPAQDISRTHLQVVPENWQVMVTDLRSTNGTFVTDPAGNSGLLPPGQATPVPIGAVLELGEGVTLTIEPGD